MLHIAELFIDILLFTHRESNQETKYFLEAVLQNELFETNYTTFFF